MNKYPRIVSSGIRKQGNWSKKTGFVPKIVGTCDICGGPAEYYIDVQVSIFRGDDETYLACRECVKSKKIYAQFL